MIQESATTKQSAFMADFFRKVDRLNRDMETIRKNITKIENAHSNVLQSTTKASSTESEEAVYALIEENSNLMQRVKDTLTEMKNDLSKSKKLDSEARIRENIHLVQTKKFISVSQEYQAIQIKYKNKYRERVGRQLKIVKPDATQEEVDLLIKADGDKDIFAKALLQIRSDQAAKNALADIQDKHRDILKLEQSLVELSQIFNDMALLVEKQGQMLDVIEENVEQAHVYVEKGIEQLQKAKASQRAGRKRMCQLICCFSVILAVIVGVLFGSKIISIVGS